MSLSKKIRFEVFKRDGFVCQYCGGHPPDKVLEVDHINPKSKGGTDDINNLVTSCFDCNRGKSNIELRLVPSSLTENVEVIKEREAQYKEYLKIMKNIDKRIDVEINDIENVFQTLYPNVSFKTTFRMSTKKFINSLGVMDVQESMEKAISKGLDPENTLRYFCGVCWSKIKENG